MMRTADRFRRTATATLPRCFVRSRFAMLARSSSNLAEACGSRTHVRRVYSRTPDLKSGRPTGFLDASREPPECTIRVRASRERREDVDDVVGAEPRVVLHVVPVDEHDPPGIGRASCRGRV